MRMLILAYDNWSAISTLGEIKRRNFRSGNPYLRNFRPGSNDRSRSLRETHFGNRSTSCLMQNGQIDS